MGTKHVCRFNYLVVGAGALGGGGYRVDRVYQIGCLSWKRGLGKNSLIIRFSKELTGAGNCIVAAAPAQAGGAPPT